MCEYLCLGDERPGLADDVNMAHIYQKSPGGKGTPIQGGGGGGGGGRVENMKKPDFRTHAAGETSQALFTQRKQSTPVHFTCTAFQPCGSPILLGAFALEKASQTSFLK